jgi:hypothetical protein
MKKMSKTDRFAQYGLIRGYALWIVRELREEGFQLRDDKLADRVVDMMGFDGVYTKEAWQDRMIACISGQVNIEIDSIGTVYDDE